MSYELLERPNKRASQKILTQLLDKESLYEAGNIILLCGPEPIKAIQEYVNYDIGLKYTLAEQDPKVYQQAKENILRDCYSKYTVEQFYRLWHMDIFKLISKCYTETPVTGIDFDFCTTLNNKTINSISLAINQIIKQNASPCFWIRTTSSARLLGRKGTYEAIGQIKELSTNKTKFVVKDEYFCQYYDTSVMYTWQGFFINQDLIWNKIPIKKERKMKKTLRQLSPTERAMVQVLARNTDKKITFEAIAKTFNLRPTSTAALKAHRTMREQEGTITL